MSAYSAQLAERMATVLDLAHRGHLPYPNNESAFFPDDPELERAAQTACGTCWITLVEGDGDPYVMLSGTGRTVLNKLRGEGN